MNKRVTIAAVGIVLTLSALAQSRAYAWGANGHRITAEVAERHLDDTTKQAIHDILGHERLAQVATWPDYIRSENAWNFAKDWHFLTVDDGQDINRVLNEADKKPGVNNVVEAIHFFKAILSGDEIKASAFKAEMEAHNVEPYRGSLHATALIFLIHVTGDVHQPLHVGREKDYGGNAVKVLWFEKNTNLHSVWDESLIEHEQLSFSEFAGFVDHATHNEIIEWQGDKPVEWAQESIDYREEVYRLPERKKNKENPERMDPPALSYQYSHDNIPAIRSRLVKGGIRLAGMLNDIYASKVSVK